MLGKTNFELDISLQNFNPSKINNRQILCNLFFDKYTLYDWSILEKFNIGPEIVLGCCI